MRALWPQGDRGGADMIFTIWRAGAAELWLLVNRDIVINVSILAFTAAFIALMVVLYKQAKCYEHEPVEVTGLEAFNAEQMEMYQTGVWLLLRDAEAPYDDRSEERRVGKECRSRWS